MTHKLILKVKKFQLSSAKRFGTVEEKLRGWNLSPYHLGSRSSQHYQSKPIRTTMPISKDNH